MSRASSPHLLEEVYNLEDALMVAGFLHSFVRHADCVKIANLAQIANVIAPILTCGDEMLIQSTFYPFELFSKRRQGTALSVVVDGPSYEGKTNGRVTFVDASAILNGRKLQVFLTNRSRDQDMNLTVDLADRTIETIKSAEIVAGNDPKAVNSHENPSAVCAREFSEFVVRNGKVIGQLPPLAFVAMTLNLK